jgi:hypothetical protein
VLDQSEVTAVIVTRGDVELAPTLETLVFDNVVVWDNSERPDWKCAGRYIACLDGEVRTDHVYWQDDDTIVPPETQLQLLEGYNGQDCLAVWGHGENPDGYDDLPLVCGGAIADWRAAWGCIGRYDAHYPLNDDFMYDADFAVGALYRDWGHVHLPFKIRDVAYNGKRLADESWQRDLKRTITNRAREIRDREIAAGAVYMSALVYDKDWRPLGVLRR